MIPPPASSLPLPLPQDSAARSPGIRTICAFCPDLVEREAALLRAFPGALLSHGCCRECNRRLKAQFEADELTATARGRVETSSTAR